MLYLDKDKYLQNANKNKKEWFEDDIYDIVFIPIVARDYLAALLFKYENYKYHIPDLDFLFDKLNQYDNQIQQFKPLNIKPNEGKQEISYYIDLLDRLQEYVRSELC